MQNEGESEVNGGVGGGAEGQNEDIFMFKGIYSRCGHYRTQIDTGVLRPQVNTLGSEARD